MHNHAGYSRSARALGLVAAAALAAAVSSLPAGIGNLGRTTTPATSGRTTDLSFNPAVSWTADANTPMASDVRNQLVSAVNNDPNINTIWVAAPVTDPNDPTSNSFSITKVGGGDVAHMTLTENDPNIDNLGVSIAGGRTVASLNKVTAINNDGDYILSITTLDHGTISKSFSSSCSIALNCPIFSALNAQIIAAFTSEGFVVKDDGSNLTFRLPGDKISAIRVSSTDTGVVTFRLDLDSPASVPSTGPLAMFLLVIVLTGSAIWMLKRSAKAHLTRS